MACCEYYYKSYVIQPPGYTLHQTHEVIGSPPNVAVPTHFAKVVLTTKPSSPSTPGVPEISTGAFMLPNAPIPDEASFKSFVVPGGGIGTLVGVGICN